MLNQKPKARWRFNQIRSRFGGSRTAFIAKIEPTNRNSISKPRSRNGEPQHQQDARACRAGQAHAQPARAGEGHAGDAGPGRGADEEAREIDRVEAAARVAG